MEQQRMTWRVEYHDRCFSLPLAVLGTEDEMRGYVESELGLVYGYRAMTPAEVDAWKAAGMKVYLALRIEAGGERRLADVETCELVAELRGREGVEASVLSPQAQATFEASGPAVVLVVVD